jgi:cytochrome c oxidase subunit 3
MSAAARPFHPPPVATAPLGMWVFLGSELLFFGGLLASYFYGRLKWSHGFGVASRHTHIFIGTANTAILLTSSAVIALAVACAQHPQHRARTARLLWITAALGLVFVVLKGYEYWKEWGEGLVPGPSFTLHETGAQLFFFLYFLMTGIHAVHLIIGVAVVCVFARASGRHRAWVNPERVDALALYWHFVDIIWIFLYPFIYLLQRASP